MKLLCALFILIFFNCVGKTVDHIDFELSLGKNDPYYTTYYRACLDTLHTKNSTWSIIGTAPHPTSKLMELCRSLYQKNPLNTARKKGTSIPKIVHQIWLGSPLPEFYKMWAETWKMNGWTYKLWTDVEADTLEFEGKNLYYAANNYGARSDILRMAILDQFGGLYVDTDFECLNPEFFTYLNEHYDFYTGLHPLDAEIVALENALIGSIPGHPIFKRYFKELTTNWKSSSFANYQKNQIVVKTGPGLFTRVFMQEGGKEYKDIVLPPTYFYPLGLKQWDSVKRFTFQTIKDKVLKPESAAVHWWNGTWKAPSANVPNNKKKGQMQSSRLRQHYQYYHT